MYCVIDVSIINVYMCNVMREVVCDRSDYCPGPASVCYVSLWRGVVQLPILLLTIISDGLLDAPVTLPHYYPPVGTPQKLFGDPQQKIYLSINHTFDSFANAVVQKGCMKPDEPSSSSTVTCF